MDLVTLEAESCSMICYSTKALKLMKLDIRQTGIVFSLSNTLLKSNVTWLIPKDLSVNGAYSSFIRYALKSRSEEVIIDGLHAEGVCLITLGTFERCHLKKLSRRDIDNKAFLFNPHQTLDTHGVFDKLISNKYIGENIFPCQISENLKHVTTLNVSNNYLDEWNMFPNCKIPFPAL